MKTEQAHAENGAADIASAYKALYSESLDAWKRIYSEAEEIWSTTMHETISSDAFAKAMAASREGYLTWNEMSRQALDKTWEQLHIPTVADVARVAELIVGVEEKLEAMGDRLDAQGVLLRRIEELVSALSAATPAQTAPSEAKASEGRGRTK